MCLFWLKLSKKSLIALEDRKIEKWDQIRSIFLGWDKIDWSKDWFKKQVIEIDWSLKDWSILFFERSVRLIQKSFHLKIKNWIGLKICPIQIPGNGDNAWNAAVSFLLLRKAKYCPIKCWKIIDNDEIL